MIDGDPKLEWPKLVSYEYDDFGRVATKTLHQKYEPIKYTYNVRGQLLTAESNNLSYTLSYEKDIKGKTTNNFRRISSVKYNHSGSSVPHGYQYTYDTQGRLTSGLFYDVTAKALTDKYAEKDITYDANGNMTHLLRTDEKGNTLHDLNFRYNDGNNGNALSSLRVGNTEHSNYEYDANGNMTRDGYRGLEITYNYLNLPSKVGNVSYIYTAGGRKIAMRDSISRYASTYRYYKGEIEHDGGGNTYLLHHPEGFCRFNQARNSTGRWIITSCIYHYMLRDHLGSTRVFTERNGKTNKLDTVQSTSYYPFGLAHKYSNTHKNKYLFSGKELQDGIKSGVALGLYDFGARMYDAVVPRWNGRDPMDQYASPYVYCGDDPVNFVDPNGKKAWEVNPFGDVVCVGGVGPDTLFSVDGGSQRTGEFFIVRNSRVLEDLSVNIRSTSSLFDTGFFRRAIVGQGQSHELFRLYKFLVNLKDMVVEWSFSIAETAPNKFQYGIATSRLQDKTAFAFEVDEIRIGVHSHPNIKVGLEHEVYSMGGDYYLLGKGVFEFPYYIYMVNSKNLYRLTSKNYEWPIDVGKKPSVFDDLFK